MFLKHDSMMSRRGIDVSKYSRGSCHVTFPLLLPWPYRECTKTGLNKPYFHPLRTDSEKRIVRGFKTKEMGSASENRVTLCIPPIFTLSVSFLHTFASSILITRVCFLETTSLFKCRNATNRHLDARERVLLVIPKSTKWRARIRSSMFDPLCLLE